MGEFFTILFLILLNAILSMVELAVISSRRSRLDIAADAGDARAKEALALIDSPTVFLSTIQIGMTLIGILTGVYGGLTLSARLSAWLSNVPVIGSISDGISFFLIVSVITFISLVFGELIPKRIALAYPERIAMSFAPLFRKLSRSCAPLVRVLELSTESFVSLFQIKPTPEPEEVTQDEIKFVLSQGTLSGAIQKSEEEMVHEVLRLGDRPVSALMTPRTDLIWLSVDDPIELNWETARNSPFQFFPVGCKDLDDLVGIVSFRDVAILRLDQNGSELASILRQPVKVPSTTSALKLLERLKAAEQQVAVAVDEYGGVDGLVTVDDLMQAIIGELRQDVTGEYQLHRRDDGSFLVDAAMDVDDVFEELGIDNPKVYEHKGYHSFGGFILNQLGRIPQEGEAISLDGYRFEIVDMDSMRIDKVLVIPPR